MTVIWHKGGLRQWSSWNRRGWQRGCLCSTRWMLFIGKFAGRYNIGVAASVCNLQDFALWSSEGCFIQRVYFNLGCVLSHSSRWAVLYGKKVVGVCENHKTSICPALLIQLPVWTFSTWLLGRLLSSCCTVSKLTSSDKTFFLLVSGKAMNCSI